jgi:hypothetical protein
MSSMRRRFCAIVLLTVDVSMCIGCAYVVCFLIMWAGAPHSTQRMEQIKREYLLWLVLLILFLIALPFLGVWCWRVFRGDND